MLPAEVMMENNPLSSLKRYFKAHLSQQLAAVPVFYGNSNNLKVPALYIGTGEVEAKAYKGISAWGVQLPFRLVMAYHNEWAIEDKSLEVLIYLQQPIVLADFVINHWVELRYSDGISKATRVFRGVIYERTQLEPARRYKQW